MSDKKALVLTNHLSNFAGSEILSLEIAETLLKIGFEVDLHCNGYSKRLVDTTNKKINISDSDKFPNIFDYAFVWSQHCLIPIAIDQHTIPDVWNTRIISAHLSPFEPFELIGLKTAQTVGAEIVANCHETAEKLEAVGVPPENIINFHNACPDNFLINGSKTRTEIRNVLVVSNHIPKEVRDAMGILKKLGIRVRYFGFKGVQKRLFPVDIQQVDAVITIGKTVQYAIKVGVPVYCYDHFGGPGWINSENFERAEMFNFSGRCCNLKKTPMVISDEIISGHRKAACDIMTIRDNIKEKYSLEKFITRIIDPPKKIIFSDGELDLIKEMVAVEAAQGSIVRRLYRAHENLSIKQKKRRIFRRLFRKIFLFSKIRE